MPINKNISHALSVGTYAEDTLELIGQSLNFTDLYYLSVLLELQCNAHITNLDLSQNNIDNLSSLTNNTSLRELCLDHNHIQNLTPLANNPTLTKLELSGNEITDISPLQHNTALTHLDIGGNEVLARADNPLRIFR